MSTTYTGNATSAVFPVAITIPADTDDLNAASVNNALDQLADNEAAIIGGNASFVGLVLDGVGGRNDSPCPGQIYATSTTGDYPGGQIAGHGAGAGVFATGGASGAGVEAYGQGATVPGVRAYGTGATAPGVYGTSFGTGDGVQGVGGAGAGGGIGVHGTGTGSNAGVQGNGATGSVGTGVKGVGGSGGGVGGDFTGASGAGDVQLHSTISGAAVGALQSVPLGAISKDTAPVAYGLFAANAGGVSLKWGANVGGVARTSAIASGSFDITLQSAPSNYCACVATPASSGNPSGAAFLSIIASYSAGKVTVKIWSNPSSPTLTDADFNLVVFGG